ncbi:MAG: hypothetical protein V2A79_03600 [Planctomycetota bacterium]
MRTTRWMTGVILAAGTVAAVGGCDKLTRNHYEMIQQSVSTTDDVARTIGDPSDKLPGQWHYEREDKHLNVIIDFNDQGVVVRKQWIDAMAPEWEDTEKPGETDKYESTQIRNIKD